MITDNEIKNLHSLILDLGKETEKIKKSNIKYVRKKDGSPFSMADKFVNEEINDFILKTNFKNIISEENKEIDFQTRKQWDFFWLVDPIDGTKDFIKKGKDYTINVALCEGNSPIFSLIYAPSRQSLYSAIKGNGAYLNGCEIKVNDSKKNKLNVVASKSHLNEETTAFINKMKKKHNVNFVQYASSLKICKIAEGEADIYPRFGPTMEWDTCAADLLLHEAGGSLTNLEKNKLIYNKNNLTNSYFICSSDTQLF